MDLVLKAVPDHCRNPMEADYPFYVLIETSGSSEAHDKVCFRVWGLDVRRSTPTLRRAPRHGA